MKNEIREAYFSKVFTKKYNSSEAQKEKRADERLEKELSEVPKGKKLIYVINKHELLKFLKAEFEKDLKKYVNEPIQNK